MDTVSIVARYVRLDRIEHGPNNQLKCRDRSDTVYGAIERVCMSRCRTLKEIQTDEGSRLLPARSAGDRRGRLYG
jgi:hypothetical protein